MTKLTMRTLGATIAMVAFLGLSHSAAAATIEGSLTAMSGTTLPATLTVQSGVTTYTVNVTADTKLVRKFGGPSSLEEFVVGDLLSVEGTVTGTTVDPTTKIKNLSIQRKGSLFWGTILSVDATAKSFVLDPSKPKKNLADQTVLTNSKTKIFQGNRAGDFDDLAAGMTVKVIGLWRKSLNKLTADRVLIKLTEFNGTVTAVDCTTNTMTVKTKKGKNETSWTVNLTTDTVIRDKHLNQIACADVKVDHRVHVRGLRTGATSLNVLQVWDRDAKKAKRTWEGSILSIDVTAKTFVIQQKKKNSDNLTVAVTPETIIVDMNGKLITFSVLEVGHRLRIWGSLSGTTVTANLILDGDLE